ncbi:MAG: hypothetical protein MZV64_18445 [Ignavibacteriales bacterium]|nr:hypothetical protein [Ignavibacteriales bacterium]
MRKVTELPYCLTDIEKLNYKTMAGWNCDITGCKEPGVKCPSLSGII